MGKTGPAHIHLGWSWGSLTSYCFFQLNSHVMLIQEGLLSGATGQYERPHKTQFLAGLPDLKHLVPSGKGG